MNLSRERDFTVANMSCPMVVMRFFLVFKGSLPASANKSKPEDVRKIRDEFHPQLETLWRSHVALKRLRSSARVLRNPAQQGLSYFETPQSPFEPEFNPNEPLGDDFVDLLEPIKKDGKSYHPLVRGSLSLNSFLDITFLRQDEPGDVVRQNGDLDGRIKTLFDALQVPDRDVHLRYPQSQDPTYCLTENDSLISGFSISTGKLLMPQSTHPHEVHLVIEVTVRVLKLGNWNVCLMGD